MTDDRDKPNVADGAGAAAKSMSEKSRRTRSSRNYLTVADLLEGVHVAEDLLANTRRFSGHRSSGYNGINMEFKRITTNPRQMGGVPCLRGLRIPVATVVALVAEGQTAEDILALYPDLEADDVRQALLFAAEAVRERALPLAAGE